MKESAKVVRETASKSVAELHSLLDLLRNADDPDVAAPTKTLRDVRALIDDSVTAGMPLVATVFVDDGEALDPHIAQAAYRIVQELLTNARKHASTVSVRLSVTGARRRGTSSSRRRTTSPPTGPHLRRCQRRSSCRDGADGHPRAGGALRRRHAGRGRLRRGLPRVDPPALARTQADSTKGIRWTT